MANRVRKQRGPAHSASAGDTSAPCARPTRLQRLLAPFASLRLTVVLLAMGIFIVLAGTMAQVDKSIWQVTDEYFRTAFAWIDLSVFFPAHWFPHMHSIRGGFYFPGGWLIGFLLAFNLLVGQAVCLRVPSHGRQLVAGLAITAVGVLVTWLVIVSGSDRTKLGQIAEIEWSTLWLVIKGLLGVSCLLAVYGLIVLDRSRKIERLLLLVSVLGLGSLVGWLFYQGQQPPINDSSLRILWQLMKGALAALVLLAGFALIFKKRAGTALMHAGVGLMMFNELIVGLDAVEGRMRIEEGQSVNFVEESRSLELAIVDRSNPAKDRVVVIPASALSSGQTIHHQDLPFDVTVVEFFRNSDLRAFKAGEPNRATAGTGRRWIAEEKPQVSGTGNQVDMPSAYVTFTEKNGKQPLGTYLVGLQQSYQGVAERVMAGGTRYDVSLRYKRAYKPYTLRLIDFRFDKYLGTNMAKNFSSDVRLTDPSRGVDRKVRIWMNNPLRYGGETFYQSGFATNPVTGAEITILQVVTNWGWMIPYVSCMIVAVGMLAHFSIILLPFLRRQSEKEPPGRASGSRPAKPKLRGAAWVVPLLVVLAGAALLARVATPPRTPDDQMRLHDFGKLPLVYQGRVKPFDTLARNTLSIISKKQTFKDQSGKTQPAVRWLLDVIARPQAADAHRVFRVENLEVLELFGLERRKGLRYSIDEFRDNLEEFDRQAKLARSRDKNQLTVFQRKIIELDNHLRLFSMVQYSFRRATIRQGHEKEDLAAAMRQVPALAAMQPPLAVPSEGASNQPWQPFATAWLVAYGQKFSGDRPHLATEALDAILLAYAEGDVGRFNDALAKYRQMLAANPPALYHAAKTDFEVAFNHAQPFLWAAWLYVFAFVLAALAWLGWSAPLNRAALWLIALTFVVHTAALISRMYISGRPPVTNLYSSAVFIGWGCVVFGLVFEMMYRLGAGNVMAAASGFTTLLVAHFLSRNGDTFMVLQAVLDTQFWLATHVTCITLGYSTTFVAGLLGILYIFLGVGTRRLTPQVRQDLSRMIYGTICFSIFFSFVGTVLGGLWADDSWGRFWGWDPKENGALIIVLWNALVLHARVGHMIRDRGLAVLAVAGNICTTWSWFGTNELGVGLHSYGFTEGVLLALGIFCLTQLAVMAVGLLPESLWLSFRGPLGSTDPSP